METIYTPYSKRHNIQNPELAGLLDYLEREMGWNIDFQDAKEWWAISQIDTYNLIYVQYRNIDNPTVYIRVHHNNRYFEIADKLDLKVFFHTYKTLLPVIRNLYGK